MKKKDMTLKRLASLNRCIEEGVEQEKSCHILIRFATILSEGEPRGQPVTRRRLGCKLCLCVGSP